MARGPRAGGRRELILAAAAGLFARRGFHGVSVDDLGAAAGVSGPALYRHFRAKEDILAELLVGASERLLSGALARVQAPAGTGPTATLHALVEFHVDFALAEPDIITVQALDLASLPEDAASTVRSMQARYVSIWAEVISQCTGCDLPRSVARAHAAFGLMNSTPHSARLPQREMAALLRAMALGAINAPAS